MASLVGAAGLLVVGTWKGAPGFEGGGGTSLNWSVF